MNRCSWCHSRAVCWTVATDGNYYLACSLHAGASRREIVEPRSESNCSDYCVSITGKTHAKLKEASRRGGIPMARITEMAINADPSLPEVH